jgi:hypothetical protein
MGARFALLSCPRSLMNRRVLSLIGFLAVAAAVVAVVLVVSGGDDGGTKQTAKDDPQPKNPRFHTRAQANHYGGPVPLTVKFYMKDFNPKGDVQYRWHFDDGTVSSARTPTHTFPKAGTYQVLMDARDSKGDNDRWNLVIGAWPRDVWGSTRPEDIPKAQGAQEVRTEKRRAANEREAAQRLAGL